MKLKNLSKFFMATTLLCAGHSLSAAPNPASTDWVGNFVTLKASDWSSVCQTGSVTAVGGCYGDLGSLAFKKVNRIIDNFIGQTAITPHSGPNTVWIQQINGNSAVQGKGLGVPTPDVKVPASNSSAASCSYFTVDGGALPTVTLVTPLGVGGILPVHVSLPSGYVTIPPGGGACLSWNSVAFTLPNTCASLPSVANQTLVVYVVCVGVSGPLTGLTVV